MFMGIWFICEIQRNQLLSRNLFRKKINYKSSPRYTPQMANKYSHIHHVHIYSKTRGCPLLPQKLSGDLQSMHTCPHKSLLSNLAKDHGVGRQDNNHKGLDYVLLMNLGQFCESWRYEMTTSTITGISKGLPNAQTAT